MIQSRLFWRVFLDSLFQLSHFSLGILVQIFIWTQLVCGRVISETLFKVLPQKLYYSHQNILRSKRGHTVKSSFWRAKKQLVAEKLPKKRSAMTKHG